MNERELGRNPNTNAATLSSAVGTNRIYVARCIQEHTGLSFNDYLNKKRIEFIAGRLCEDPGQKQEALYFEAGYRSRQTAYRNFCGLDPKVAEEIAGSFGLGMGNMEGTCGSLVGAGMVIGLVTKDRNLARKRMKQVMEKFKERNGTTQCRQLKGVDTGVVRRDCLDCIADAAEFLESVL